ncbi:hypothetical protein NDU88_007303 [Pleurodeles waltl]|uniref:Uncharacterized protein n=1 Tax=Pleurodeles waltl TaxID=8319 RepID=A0AAV7QNN4_PLEWA|nr:hypothetical protein NDU88_007303 [Pleurodeles waltl]
MESAFAQSIKAEPVNAITAGATGKKREKTKSTSMNRSCYMCGGSYPHQGKCPAVEKQCTNCQILNHFAKVCHSTKKSKSDTPKSTHTTKAVQHQDDVPDMDDDDEPEGTVYIIHTTEQGSFAKRKAPRCRITVAVQQVTALIDTGPQSTYYHTLCSDSYHVALLFAPHQYKYLHLGQPHRSH